MLYTYICTKCKDEKSIDVPLGNDLPREFSCGKDGCTGTMKHDFISKIRDSRNSIIIPESFKATSKLYEKQGLYGKYNVHEKTLY